MKKWCFIYWTKGNLYGTLVVHDTRKEADEDRLKIGREGLKTGVEVSALAEMQLNMSLTELTQKAELGLLL